MTSRPFTRAVAGLLTLLALAAAWWLLAPAVAAAALVALWLRRPPTPPARLELSWAVPTDFLLDVPGDDLLRETPRFTMKGPLP